jgi:hypothetical protein
VAADATLWKKAAFFGCVRKGSLYFVHVQGRKAPLHPRLLPHAVVQGRRASALRILLGSAPWNFTQDERSGWSGFLVSLVFRNPEAIAAAKTAAKEVFDNALPVLEADYANRQPHDPSTYEAYTKGRSDDPVGRAAAIPVQRVINSPEIGNHIVKMRWMVLHDSRPSFPFLTSDRPMLITNGIIFEQSQIILPISPRHVFVATNNLETENYIKDIMERRQLIPQVNYRVAKQARKYVYGSDDTQLRFLENRLGLRHTADPMEQMRLAISATPAHIPVMRRSNMQDGLRAQPPAGFVTPCAPMLADRPPAGQSWVHEIKFDGWRMIARKAGTDVRLWTCRGRDVTAQFSQIAGALAILPIDNVILDGDAVCMAASGSCLFHGLGSAAGAASACSAAFDLIALEGADLRRAPLEERRMKLSDLLMGATEALVLSEQFSGDGAAIFEQVRQLGLEEIVSKRLGSPYVSGRSNSWVKTLSPTDVRI